MSKTENRFKMYELSCLPFSLWFVWSFSFLQMCLSFSFYFQWMLQRIMSEQLRNSSCTSSAYPFIPLVPKSNKHCGNRLPSLVCSPAYSIFHVSCKKWNISRAFFVIRVALYYLHLAQTLTFSPHILLSNFSRTSGHHSDDLNYSTTTA